MKKEYKNIDDHHCSIIESKLLKAELAECYTDYDNKEDRYECRAKFEAISKKREQACKFS